MDSKNSVVSVSADLIDRIYEAFTTNHLIQCAFKTRISQLNLKKTTISGNGITPEHQKIFSNLWIHPIIFNVATMICMFGAVQFKVFKVSSNPDIFLPKIGLFSKQINAYEEEGEVKIYVPKNKDEDLIFMLKDSYSIGIDYRTGKICSDVSLVLPLLESVEHMEKIHKQVRIDLALPPVVIQEEKKTDFQRQMRMRAEQLTDPTSGVDVTTNPQGKIIPKPSSAKPTVPMLKPDNIIASLEPDNKSRKRQFGIIQSDENSKKQFLSIQNQHFLADGLAVAGNVPEPKIIFNLIQEKTALQLEINRIFNIYEGDVAPISQQRSLISYKTQLETMIQQLWTSVNEQQDVIVNIPLDFKENIL